MKDYSDISLDLRKGLVETLEEIRYKQRISQKEFAGKLKVSGTYYNKLISKEFSPSLDKLQAIAMNLEIPLYILLFKSEYDQIHDDAERLNLEETYSLMQSLTDHLYSGNSNSVRLTLENDKKIMRKVESRNKTQQLSEAN